MAKILVIDDDVATCRLVQHCLAEAGHEVTTLTRVAGSIEVVDQRRPDLVLLDLGLPDASGEEFLQKLREHPYLAHLRVVLFSGNPELDRVARTLGANGFIRKEATFDALAAQVARYL